MIYARQNVLKPDLAVSCQAGDHRDSRRQSTSRAKCMYRCLKQTMPSQDAAKIVLVCRLTYNGDVVAFKMAAGKAVRAGLALGGRISESICNRRATQPPAHFQSNPPGRGRLAVFPRCSLLTYRSRYARRSRLEKQPTDRRRKPMLVMGPDT